MKNIVTEKELSRYSKDILRNSFAYKFEIERNGVSRVFITSSARGLQIGIVNGVTNGLGYEKIRKSKKTNITTEELYSHLKKMDKTVKAYEKAPYWVAIKELFYIHESYVKDLNKYLDEKLDLIKEEVLGLGETFLELKSSGKSLIDVYENQLKEKDAKIKRLEKRLKKKSLLSRIFN